jgi:hypothetical protein
MPLPAPSGGAVPATEELEPDSAEASRMTPLEDERVPQWPDDAAESSFLADLRDSGEPVVNGAPKPEASDESDPKALPALDELVQRIPAHVREILDDLFRAKFTKVRKVPAKALKA